MTDPILVSVIIRTKDRPQLLPEAIDSVRQQSYSPLQIVVINDGGEDVSGSLPDLENEQGRSLVYRNLQPGQGRSAAANHGLDTARGDYLIFLDDDDWFEPEHIAGLVAVLQDNPTVLAAYSCVRAVSNRQQQHADALFNHCYDHARLQVENFLPIHSVLFSRRLPELGCRFDPAFDRLEDWDFWLQVACHTSMLYLDQCTASYRIADTSGYGVKEDLDSGRDRMAIYRKWQPELSDAALLELMNRARQYPRIRILENETTELKDALKVRVEQLDKAGNALMETRHKLTRSEDLSRRQAQEIEDISQQLQHQQGQLTALHGELDTIYNSRSWRLTKPLRYLSTAMVILRTEGLYRLLHRVWNKVVLIRAELPSLESKFSIADHYTPLTFPEPDPPLVSIVIPVYNKHLYTFHCLQAVLKNTTDIDYEVIVVDDRSQDETPQMLEQMSGVRVLTNAANLGFIKSCNAGAEKARGQYLVLLNNDTEPKPGWLSALVKTFTDFPDAGLVGSRLVYPDGRLQEAGGIVWQDGSAWNYGRMDDPNKPEFSYCREADYCSGASLMIPTEQFRQLGGFDELYLPAYYEDTDLAFRVRQAGRKVYYQAMSTVVHFEGITSGTSAESGTKRYQDINHGKFHQRWQKTLASHRANGSLPHLEKERLVDKRVLILDARVLMPDHDSGSLRMFSLCRIFQELGYKVSFLPDNLQYHEKYTTLMQSLGMECLYHPYTRSVSDHLQQHGHLYDIVLLSRADVAENHITAARENCPHARFLFDTVDLHFLRELRQAEIDNNKTMLESAMIRKYQELGIARQCDKTLVVSPIEAALFSREAPDVDVALLSNIHKTEATELAFGQRKDMLFIGNFEHPPNTDAMLFFLDDIFPAVLQAIPDARVLVVGGHVPLKLKKRASNNIIMSGFVSDIKPLFNRIRLSIAPLRFGAGVKGKINSSMAYGVPVVTTAIGAEGMGLVHDQDVLIADSAKDFAREVIRVYQDEALWQRLRSAGLQNIEQHFSFAVARRQLEDILSGFESD